MYFTLNQEGSSGFMVSNRLIPEQRATTREEDLFFVTTVPADLLVQGSITDKKTQKPLLGARVNAFHKAQGEKVVFFSAVATDGTFAFAIPPGVEAWVQAEKPEYVASTLKIQDGKVNANVVSLEFRLETEVMPDEIAAVPAAPIVPTVPEEAADKIPARKEEEGTRKNAKKETVRQKAPATPREPALPRDTPPTPAPPSVVTPVAETVPPPSETTLAVEERSATGDGRTINGRTPYQNKVKLAPPRSPGSPQAKVTPAEDITSVPSESQNGTRRDASTEPATKSTIGTSEPTVRSNTRSSEEASLSIAESVAFTGSGLDKRYKGKRVDKRKFSTEALDYEGIYYRIQLESVENPDAAAPRYAAMNPQGTLETETLPGMGVTRVLVGVYRSLEEANKVLNHAKRSGFKHAFIVRYEDGVRLRRWK